MDAATQRLIEQLHSTPLLCVLAVTGGGSRASALLLEVAGASRTILEVLVPYHEASLIGYLGQRPTQLCSALTSKQMAQRSLERARYLAPGQPVLGLGCTASLATDRPKKGDHRFHLSACTAYSAITCSLILHKGARDRAGEEAVLDALLLNLLAEMSGLPDRLEIPLLADELVVREESHGQDALVRFLDGKDPTLCCTMDGQLTTSASRPTMVLAGSFNPVHQGHWGLLKVAAQMTGLAPAFELSVANVDKPPLGPEEVRRRLRQFGWRAPVWLTRAPTFVEKARVFPGVVFLVGYDTAVRLLQPRYYHDSEDALWEALETIHAQDCRFLVAGRVDGQGMFRALRDVQIPPEFGELFSEIPESAFRLDLSSTELRQTGQP